MSHMKDLLAFIQEGRPTNHPRYKDYMAYIEANPGVLIDGMYDTMMNSLYYRENELENQVGTMDKPTAEPYDTFAVWLELHGSTDKDSHELDAQLLFEADEGPDPQRWFAAAVKLLEGRSAQELEDLHYFLDRLKNS